MNKLKLFKKARRVANYIVLVTLVFNASMFSVFVPEAAHAADSGFLAPTANTNSGWSNPQYAYVANETPTVLRAVADSSSDVVDYRNFGFSIPAGATINGVAVSVEGYTGGTRQADVTLSWDNGSHYTSGSNGLKTTNMPGTSSSSESVRVLGGATDTWGRTWPVSDTTNPNFRVRLDATSGGGSNLYIDQITAKIYYTPNTAPTAPTLVSPADLAITKNTSQTFSWNPSTDSDGDTLSYVLHVENDHGLSEDMLATSPYPHAAFTQEGIYSWKVRAYDGYQYSDWSATRTFTLDTTSPVISLVSATPSSFSPAVGQTTTIGFNFSDNLSGDLKNVTVKVYDPSNTLVDTLIDGSTLSQGNQSTVWDGTGRTTDGVYTVKVDADDQAGNPAVQASTQVTVDTTPPSGTLKFDSGISLFNNDQNPIISGSYSNVTIDSFTQSTNTSDVDHVGIKFTCQTSSCQEAPSVPTAQTVANTVYTQNVNLTDNGDGTFSFTNQGNTEYFTPAALNKLPEGSYIVSASAYDTLGNASNPIVLAGNLVIDITAPAAVTNLKVTGQTNTTVSLSWDAVSAPDLGGYRVLTLNSDGTVIGTRDVGNVTSAIVTGLNPDTNYSFVVVAYDKAMNSSTASNIVSDKTNTTPVVLAASTSTSTSSVKKATSTPAGVVEAATDTKPQDSTPEPAKKDDKKTNNNGFSLWWLVLLAILAGGGYYYYVNHPESFNKKSS